MDENVTGRPAVPDTSGLRDATDESAASDSDMEVVYVSTDEEAKRQLRFNPVRGGNAQLHRRELRLSKSGADADPSRDGCEKGGAREQCYGQAFLPVPLGEPCKTVDVQMDGNCLFRAVSYALCCDDAYHMTIRERCVLELLDKEDLMREMLPDQFENTRQYVQEKRMNESGTWGTELEISAMANLFGLPIHTYYRGAWVVYRPWENGRKRRSTEEQLLVDKIFPPQGIYITNENSHYKPVLCVKVRGSSDCYGFCNHGTRSAGTSRCDFCKSPRSQELGLKRAMCDRCRGHGYDMRLDIICDHSAVHEDPGEVPRERLVKLYECANPWIDRGTEVEDEECAERDATRRQRAEALSSLMDDDDPMIREWANVTKLWNDCLDRLKQKWWGETPFEIIVSALKNHSMRNVAVVSEPRDIAQPGALYSITWKNEDGVIQSAQFALRGTTCVCANMPGARETPSRMLVTVCKLHKLTLIPKPAMLLCYKRSRVCEHRIPVQLHAMIRELKDAWWGTFRSERDLPNFPDLLKITDGLQVRVSIYGADICTSGNLTNARQGAMVVFRGPNPRRLSGYLFEIAARGLRDRNRKNDIVRYTVVFNAMGFFALDEGGKPCTALFNDIVPMMSHFAEERKLVFLGKN